MTKRFIILAIVTGICMISSWKVQAQDLEYTQYYLNLPGINPGFTGLENFWDLKMSFRQGATNFTPQNKSIYLSSYGTINSSAQPALQNNSLRMSDPNAYNQLESNKSTRRKLLRKHGIGGMLYNREMDTYQSFNVSMNYAYHLPVSKTLDWSLGTSVRYTSQQIGFSGLTVRDDIHDLYYQQLVQSGKGRMDVLVMDFGSAIYSDRFYFGLSSAGLINRAIGISDFNGFLITNYSLQTMRLLRLGANLELSPMLKLDYSMMNQLSGGATARIRYKNLVHAGLGYQSNGKLSGMLGFTLEGKYSFNYSYDHYLAALGNFNVNVHEIVFGVALFNKYGLNTKIW